MATVMEGYVNIDSRKYLHAWCKSNQGDDNLITCTYINYKYVMPPKNDICVALKKFFIICKDSQGTWQTIFYYYLLLHTTFYNMHRYEHANHRDVNYHVYIYHVQIYTRKCCVLTQFDGVVDQEPMCKVVYSCIT